MATRKRNRKKDRLIVCGILGGCFLCGGAIGFGIGYNIHSEPQAETEYVVVSSTNHLGIAGVSAALYENLEGLEVNQADMETQDIDVVESAETVTSYFNIPLSEELQDYIRFECEYVGIDPSLVFALIEVESNFDSQAISETNDYGLMQINKSNFDWISEEYGTEDFLDPYENIHAGVNVLAECLAKGDSIQMGLMVYNLGYDGAKELWRQEIYSTSYSRAIVNLMSEYEVE